MAPTVTAPRGAAVPAAAYLPPVPSLATAGGPVTLAIVNARVWTGVPHRPWAEAVVVRGERLTFVGASAEARRLAAGSPGARVVDARGAMLLPGFIDAHVHFVEGGLRLSSVQLRDAHTPAVFVERLRAFAATVPAGTWITGGDWDHEHWGGALPTRAWLDAAVPDRPVWVHRHDGHMALANGCALRLAGVDAATPDVDGGAVVRDAAGAPTGLLKDNAMALVDRAVPPLAESVAARAIAAAGAYVAERGVTAVHTLNTPWDHLDALERARAAGQLRTRVHAAVPMADWARMRDLVAEWRAAGRRLPGGLAGDRWLQIGAVKAFMDGSLGSHTAAMLAPFADAASGDPNPRGLYLTPPETLAEWAAGADAAGLPLAVHAIGDAANRAVLDAFERLTHERGPRDRRWRVEHAQHLHPADVGRFAALGVIASMQPYHAADDGRWAGRVLGAERARLAWPARSLLDAGVRLAFGSDWFVAPPAPLEGVWAAVTRQTLDGRHPGGWVPEERVTVEEALRAYTAGAAYAAFAEADLGTLEAGKLADFVLVDRDLTRVAPEAIREARVLLTVTGGTPVYDAAGELAAAA